MRARPRGSMRDGSIVLLEDQDRGLWNREMIAEGLALIDKAMRHRRPGPYQVQAAIAALHARAARPEDTDWAQIDLLYAALETLQPSPVVTLNRAVAVSKVRGPEAALAMIEPLARAALRLFPLLRRARAPCCCSSAATTRPAPPSTAPSRSPIPRPKPPTSGCISIVWSRTARQATTTPGLRANRQQNLPAQSEWRPLVRPWGKPRASRHWREAGLIAALHISCAGAKP